MLVCLLDNTGLLYLMLVAEYWAGSLEIHNLEGFGVDAFLQISKLGNKNERCVAARNLIQAELTILRLTTRATMDAV
jgi:hypothetical protein